PAFIELGNEIKANSIYLRTLLPVGRLPPGLNYHTLPAYLHPEFETLRANAIAAMRVSPVPVNGEPDTWDSPIFPEPLARKIEAEPPQIVARVDALRDALTRTRRDRHYHGFFRDMKYKGEPNSHFLLGDRLKDNSNPPRRTAPFKCRAVYNNLYVNEMFLR